MNSKKIKQEIKYLRGLQDSARSGCELVAYDKTAWGISRKGYLEGCIATLSEVINRLEKLIDESTN